MEKIVMIAQFVLGLSFIVGVHELGHLLFAKLFGMRVESYCIGFPPKLFRFKWGETEYSIGALPFGGAVKISGMVDEYLEDNGNATDPKPWEFRAKPAWQRMIVMLGGIIFNIISGLIIYSAITFHLGDTYISKNEVNKYGILPNELGTSLGFIEGDQIIKINGQDFERFNDVMAPQALMANNGYYTVLRDGNEIRIEIPSNFIEKLSDSKGKTPFITPIMPFAVGKVLQGGGACQAGLQPKDEIVEVNGIATPYFHKLKDALEANAGKKINLTYKRGSSIQSVEVQVSSEGTLGFEILPLLTYEKKDYNIAQAVSAGSKKAFSVVYTNLIGLKKLITGKISASKSLSGPIGIAQIFGKQFDWINFWSITGFLSMILALTNLLPIPALDGGHAIFILCEMITGRRLPEKFLLTMQKIGMALLLALILYSVINDIYKLF